MVREEALSTTMKGVFTTHFSKIRRLPSMRHLASGTSKSTSCCETQPRLNCSIAIRP